MASEPAWTGNRGTGGYRRDCACALVVGVIPVDAIASVVGALLVVVFYLARQIARLAERVARLEGEADAKRREALR